MVPHTRNTQHHERGAYGAKTKSPGKILSTIEKALTRAFGEPTPKQEEFYTATTRYVGYGGARGGGKSHAVRAKATILALAHEGIRMLIVRRSFPELRRNYTRPLLESYATFPALIKPTYSESEKTFRFPTGSTIELGFCDTDADVGQYIGNEWDVLFIDEATQLTEYQYGALNSCVRGVNKHPKRTYVTCNPGGVGHSHIMRLYIDRKYHKGEVAKDHTFIQARVWDNLPLLMSDDGFMGEIKRRKVKKITEDIAKDCMYFSDYVRSLSNLPPDLREAWLNGNWHVFAGQMFSELDDRKHICEPVEIKPHWTKSVAIDYGLDMLAVLWIATDETGKAYVYHEFESPNMNIPVAADAIKSETAKTGHRVLEYIAPPDLWHRTQDRGVSRAESFAECGIPLVKAGNDRVAGWSRVKEYLMVRNGSPGLVIFNHCVDLIDCLKKLQYDPKKTGDAAVQPHEVTHKPDALRYFCSRRHGTPALKEPPNPDPFRIKPPKKDMHDYAIGGYV